MLKKYVKALVMVYIKNEYRYDLQYAFLEGIRRLVQGKKDYFTISKGKIRQIQMGPIEPNKKYYDHVLVNREGEKTLLNTSKKGPEDL